MSLTLKNLAVWRLKWGGARRPREELLTELEQRQGSITQLLDLLPDSDITELSDNRWHDIVETIRNLLNLLTEISGVGISSATKMLHPYARKLIPILDRKCIPYNYGVNNMPQDIVPVINRIRRDMRQSEEDLFALKEDLEAREIGLSPLRIFDILLWSKWKEHTVFDARPEPLFVLHQP